MKTPSMSASAPIIAVCSLTLFAFAMPAEVSAAEGGLVKLACPSGAASDHTCRAVYHHGRDGKRHAFPNEKIYFTWHEDFSGVTILSAGDMAAIPLGRNVTYRPGVKMVKFATAPTTYAVALGGVLRPIADEAAASALYGTDWNTKIDDVSDAFFPDYRFGAPIASGNDYAPSEELAWADGIDDDLPKTRRDFDVVTPAGTFRTEVVSLHRDRFIMRTSVAGSPNCSSDCSALDLRTHAERFDAEIGMHGSYFCPPDYTGCGGTNTFLSPFFDSLTGIMSNESSLNVHKGPVAAVSDDGSWRFFRTARDFGGDVTTFEATYGTELVAAASNYPALIEDGAVIVLDEPRYEDPMKTKAVRAGFGWDERFIRLAVVRSASVLDLAHVLAELGSAYALNMDGGGSAALLYDDAYLFGPGRDLPNAIIFVERP